MHNLHGFKVAALGGDAREVILVEHLADLGAVVKTYGLPVSGKNMVPCQRPIECLANVQALILPVPGVNHNMQLHSAFLEDPLVLNRAFFELLPKRTPVLVGMARKPLRDLLAELELELIELMKLDDVAILNSIPSAEGAVQMAMEKLQITIHGSNSVVLGFGRTGQTLAKLLSAMHSNTIVVARNPSQLARATAMGLKAVSFKESVNYLYDTDVVFNTVPAQVIDESFLRKLPTKTLVIDLASAPGGTDFNKADELGIEAILAPGLPGKVAPKTAGMILAQVVPRVLMQKLKS